MNRKVVVIGIDGGTWDILGPLAHDGRLPTLAKLIRDGVHSKLVSTIPPVSAPAWITFATGKNPGKHGCFDFLLPRTSLENMTPVSARTIKARTFYEILDAAGKRCTIINLPGSYPPRIRGNIITSILTGSDSCIYPNSLIEEIPELKNYRIMADLKLLGRKSKDELIEDIINTERIRFECSKELFQRDWDFFFVLFSGTDVLQHRMFSEIISDRNHPGIELYENLDEYVSWFLKHIPSNATAFIISDHGFKSFKKAFLVNSWLRKEGYLRIHRGSKSSSSYRRPPIFERQKKFRISLPLSLVSKFFTHFDSRIVPLHRKLREILNLNLELKFRPDWSQSVAYATVARTNVGGIFLNDRKRFEDGILEASSCEDIRNDIMKKLVELRDPDSDEAVIIDIWKKENLYSGQHLELAPDILFLTSKEYQVRTNLFVDDIFGKALLADGAGQSHSLEGVFLAFGDCVKRGNEIMPVGLCDLAPTILRILDIPIPEDMDGRVLEEIFKEDCQLATGEAIFEQVNAETDRIAMRVQNLKSNGRL